MGGTLERTTLNEHDELMTFSVLLIVSLTSLEFFHHTLTTHCLIYRCSSLSVCWSLYATFCQSDTCCLSPFVTCCLPLLLTVDCHVLCDCVFSPYTCFSPSTRLWLFHAVPADWLSLWGFTLGGALMGCLSG